MGAGSGAVFSKRDHSAHTGSVPSPSCPGSGQRRLPDPRAGGACEICRHANAAAGVSISCCCVRQRTV